MARKKSKKQQQQIDTSSSFVVLQDEKKSSHIAVPHGTLVNCKTNQLKIGDFASFNGNGNRSARCRGTIIFLGTREQCDAKVELINKSNHAAENSTENLNADNDTNEIESNSDLSNHFSLDEEAEDQVIRQDNEQSDEKDEMLKDMSSIQDNEGDIVTKENLTTISSTTMVPNSQSSSNPPLTTNTSLNNEFINRNNNNDDGNFQENRKRKESEDVGSEQKKKRTHDLQYPLMLKDLERENRELKKENEMYRTNWISKPTGAAALYFIEMGNTLSNAASNENNLIDMEATMISITTTLGMTEEQLKSCTHATDITKTCRQITRQKYPNPRKRAQMRVAFMKKEVLKAIRTYARLVHPAQSKASDSTLNNSIGNVFATDKRRLEIEEAEIDDLTDEENDAEDPEQ